MSRARPITVSPTAYRSITLFALVALVIIIVSGAAVRLTGSGLGCPDWPTCANNRVVAPVRYHAMVEFVNRMFTGIVSVAVILAALGSLARRPRRRDLTYLSLGLVAGVFAQVLLGGLTVRSKLTPPVVMAHFLLSMVLVANAVVLRRRAGRDDADHTRSAHSALCTATRVLVAVAAVVIVTGTIVTGAGPHGGDENVRRLGFAVPTVARIHGVSELVLLTLTLALVWRARRIQPPPALIAALNTLVLVEVAQGFIGYMQYLLGVPELLVGVHVLGAVLVWVSVLEVALAASSTVISRLQATGILTQA
ncbi:MAG: COX15/CtaA family protein [Acidimicrobiales bacterium]